MKSKNVILLFLLLFSVSVSAKQNLKKYYSNVFKAEQCLLDKDYKKAAKHYETAFKNKDWAFEMDLINAVYCEVMSGNQSVKNCNNYAKRYAEYYGGGFCGSYSLFTPETDILLFNCNINDSIKLVTREKTKNISLEIEKIRNRDQQIRIGQNKNNSPEKDTLSFYKELYNVYEFKTLMQTVNVFDERLVSYSDISIFFNHWFMVFEWEQDYFLSITLKAVHNGTFDARNFVDMADILSWRTDWNKTNSPYGSHYFSVFQEDNTNRYFVYSPLDKGTKESKAFLKILDKKRKSIYLDGVEKSAINNFKLWLLWHSLDYQGVQARPLYKVRLNEDDFKQEIQNALKKNPKLNYYITDEHDFN